MTDIRDDARAGFEAVFGRAPDGLWSAPGRVNLIGEHTDYNEGFVLPFAIDRRTLVALGVRDDRRVRVASTFADELAEIDLDALTPESLDGWSAYPLGVAWALGEHGADLSAVPGVDLFIDSDVPVGAGLSSSAAIESAVAMALNDSWRLGLDRPTLARVGQRAENVAVGAPTGIMDQSASLLGAADHAVFLDCRSLVSELVPLGLAEAGLAILVIDTGVKHAHATGGYGERRAACERGAAALGASSLRDLTVDDLPRARQLLDDVTFRRVRHVITENQRVLDTVEVLRESGAAAIGGLLDASHRSMRDDFEISVPELDLAVETAVAAGAIGARMTGGGFGGSAIALVRVDDLSRIQVAVDNAFGEHAYGQPDTFVVTASDGATRN
ncbi:MAG: galactokinase [Microcella pacifica]|jgi:galactokinase|uniref:Galactokinase n=1 Tax=Microcella pacifica TaxID=2591847 RepID=A0A9E5JQT0_9MICO|nr:galactokinase [Microcella pacifica]MBR22898.1 galactokinase [Leifsonia sp.]NHF64119.1 galactokinase [Microcella pacifica]